MRYFLLIIALMFNNVQAGGNIQEDLRETPEMSERCVASITYYQARISKYELKVHLSAGQKIKVHYYKSELASWQDYCYGDGNDPVFTED